VTVSGPSSCHPAHRTQIEPCAVTLEAQAQDPDGDPLTYQWSGCADGTARAATCPVDRLGQFVAIVTVSDGQGHSVDAEKAIEGVNAAPTNDSIAFYCSYGSWPYLGGCEPSEQPDCPPVPTGTYVNCGSFFNNPVFDQEGDEIECDEVVVTGAGCRPSLFYECGGAGDAASFDFTTPASPTVCTYEAYLRDAWGARAKFATIRLPVVPRAGSFDSATQATSAP
jgi:hypothetical protein